jgi:hypothetical protein
MPAVYLFMFLGLLVPLADVAVVGFKYVSAWQALRAFGQSIQYYPPPDVTNASGWKADPKVVAGASANTRFPISNIQVFCGASPCAAGNIVSPKYYSYTTTVTLTPMVLRSVLCTSGGGNPCSFTLTYSERFQ